ncbi:hypothetical protein RJ640_001753 [Escallonia rubra]|uniref:Retrovirus-related Pol polyprotein from transposon TNT 1-94-like beta-barrel domain-containing protein n=1 Tax=Escallonia rubra TaxID=112253 RepID=A0AA88RPU8_9ASTE|nr:hypothetical protein RJ640_001753 [Escallonia rubra]
MARAFPTMGSLSGVSTSNPKPLTSALPKRGPQAMALTFCDTTVCISDPKILPKPAFPKWGPKAMKGVGYSKLSPTPQVAFNFSKEKTTAAVVKALEKLYEKTSASNKVFLMKRLFTMRMLENGSIVDHLNDFNDVTNQSESTGINFDDEIRALLFLCSLPDSWNKLVTTVSNSTISGTLTLNDVLSFVMNDETRRKTIGDGISSSTALSVKSKVDDNSKGKVEIKLSNGGILVLKDVRHIPKLQKTLISISGLDREGYFVAFGEKQWKVIKGSMVVARGERVGTLYTLSEDGQVPRTENSEVLDETTDTEIGSGDQQQVPETLNLRRSSRKLANFPIVVADLDQYSTSDDASVDSRAEDITQESKLEFSEDVDPQTLRPYPPTNSYPYNHATDHYQ